MLERRGVLADLALCDEAALIGVHELDRILDCDDVIAARPVHEVDEAAERRRLAAAGGPRHEDEALREVAESLDFRRNPHLVGRNDARRNGPDHRADPWPGAKDVHTESDR